MDFIVGREYRRRDLHDQFGGSRQSGISPSADYPLIFLFTGDTGELYGYRDGFQEDGTFWYTGEGQLGNMEMSRGNLAIKESSSKGKRLHLFERSKTAFVTYLGEAEYLNFHEAIAPDREGSSRKVIVFELALLIDSGQSEVPSLSVANDKPSTLWKDDLLVLRERSLSKPKTTSTITERKQLIRIRNEAVRVYVQRRAEGVCECCELPAPFSRPNGTPYLEPHHIRRLADGGPDHPRWVAAICPNCHRRIHSGVDGDALNRKLANKLGKIEGD